MRRGRAVHGGGERKSRREVVLLALVGCGPSADDVLARAVADGFEGVVERQEPPVPRLEHDRRGELLRDRADVEHRVDGVGHAGVLDGLAPGPPPRRALRRRARRSGGRHAPPLLTHTGGFPDALGRDDEPIGRDAHVALAWESPLVDEPGRSFHYSNTGARDAGLPLGLGEPEPVSWHLVGNGGVLTTPAELRRWVEALDRGEVLTARSREELWGPQVHTWPRAWYGHGWGVEDWLLMGWNVNHDGSDGAFFAHVVWWPEQETYVAVFTNHWSVEHEDLAWELSRAVLR